jgi:NAD+ kinase
VADSKKIGVLAHPYRPSTIPFAEEVFHTLQQRGCRAWLRTMWDVGKAQPLVEDSELVIAIGGDGAMLRASRVCAPFKVPILGINAGYLGFLTEASPDEWADILDRILNGDYWIEERMMITAEVWRGDQCIASGDALNDVVISRGAIARSVWLETYIDDQWTTTYNADGLIVSTPTGSTAYALAVGGPILPPELNNILMIPVAPHLSMDRSLVLSGEAKIKVLVVRRNLETEVTVTIDGELVESMAVDDYVLIRASDNTSHFVRMREPGYFYRSLLDRLEPRLAIKQDSGSQDQISFAETTSYDEESK